MVDLHTHSNASDGELDPAALVEKAAALGLRALALTDHDTVAGLEKAERAAKSRGMAFIPGIELEITQDPQDTTEGSVNTAVSGEFHLLGLGIRPNEPLLETLVRLGGVRERRNRAMVEKMRAAGIEISYEAVKSFAGTSLVGRPHFGAFLVSRRMAKNQEQAFKRWLGKGRPFYVPKEGLAFEKAAALIHRSGGAAVLAHPLSLYVSWGRLPGLVAALKEKGLDGIEAWHPAARVKDCKRLEELGRSLGLCITAGSDFHGSARPERKLGHTAGDRKIETAFVEELEKALAAIQSRSAPAEGEPCPGV